MAPRWWEHAEEFVCGVRGHCVPARAALPDEWRPLEAQTTAGRRLGLCVRCGAWLEIGPPDGRLERLADDDLPRRGAALRQALILRLIAVERGIHSVLFGLAAIGLLLLRIDLPGVQSSARRLTQSTTNSLAGPGQTASRDAAQRFLGRVLHLQQHTLGVLIATAAVYAVVEGVEAVGLWHERRWAEYLTALATAGFLPFEVKEIVARVTAIRIGALIINLVVLVYLVWRKHLFGIGSSGEGEGDGDDRVAALRARVGTIDR